jgi:MFS superfamily sulfate permease-like transporter
MSTWQTLVVDWIITNNTSIITSAFTSLGSLITSPLGGLIIFGLAISYLFYVKKMAKAKNARG